MAANLKDVAARAGVSVRTVSNVVSNAAPVAAATREKVLRAIEELQYRPNLAARNLRQGRTGIIGLAIPEFHSPYFGELTGLLVDAAQERGWTVLIDQTAGRPERERGLMRGVAGHAVDGMIVSPWSVGPAEMNVQAGAAAASTAPLVVLGEFDSGERCDHVVIDNVAAAREATGHLVALGRRRIAAVGAQPHLHNGTAELRLRGYRQALTAAGLPDDPRQVATVASLHRAEGLRAAGELLDAQDRPDAVFCFSDELALGVLRAAHERGLRVPQDLAVAGFDDIEDGRYAVPALTTVSPDKAEIATLAVQCLADRIYGRLDHLPARRLTARHRLLVRESSAA